MRRQVAARRAELGEQKRNLLDQQTTVRGLQMDEGVEQCQIERTCTVAVCDNLVQKLQASIVVKDGVVQSISEGA